MRTPQASEAQADIYRQEIRRLAALVLRIPTATTTASVTKDSSSRGVVDGDIPPAPPGSERRTTPPGRGKRPPDRSRVAEQGDMGLPTCCTHDIHRAADSALPIHIEANRDTVKITRMGWSTTPGDKSLFWRQREVEVDVPAPKDERRSSKEGQEQRQKTENFRSTKGTAGSDMDGGLTISGAASSVRTQEKGEKLVLKDTTSSAAAAARPPNSGRAQTKRAPGWGPSASAGRYSEAAGVSRLRLALQGRKSSIFPEGTFARLSMVPESSGIGGRPDGNAADVFSGVVRAAAATPLAERAGTRTVLDDDGSGEGLPVGAEAGAREGSGVGVGHGNVDDKSANGGGHTNGDELTSIRYATVDLEGSKPTDGSVIGKGGSGGPVEENVKRSDFSGSLSDIGNWPPSCFEVVPHEQIPSTMRVDEVPTVPIGKRDGSVGISRNQMKVEGGSPPPFTEMTSVPLSSSPADTASEGIACRYRRRDESANKPTPRSPSTAASSDFCGRSGLRRSSSSPLPPLSPCFGSSTLVSPDDTMTPCHSAGGYANSTWSSVSEGGTPDESAFAHTNASSPCGPVVARAAAPTAYGVGATSTTSTVIELEQINESENGSGSNSRSGNTPMRNRNPTALRRGGRGRGGGGGHSEICAILGGTDGGSRCDGDGVRSRGERTFATSETARGYTGHERSLSEITSSARAAAADDSEDEPYQKHCAKWTRQRKRRRRPAGGGGGEALSDEPSSGSDHVGGSASLGSLSDNSISDLSDEGFDDGMGRENETHGEAELSSSGTIIEPSGAKTRMLGSGGPILAGISETDLPPGAVVVSLPNVDSTDRMTADRTTASPASLSVMVAGGVLYDNNLEAGQTPPQRPKPRITELYHLSPVSSTSTSSSFGGHRSRRGRILSGVDCCAGSGNEGDEEGPLEISLGSSDGSVDTFTGVQEALLGSLNLR